MFLLVFYDFIREETFRVPWKDQFLFRQQKRPRAWQSQLPKVLKICMVLTPWTVIYILLACKEIFHKNFAPT